MNGTTRMHARRLIDVALLGIVLVLAACQEMDPYTRPDTWQPTGVNAGNIGVMVANPNDLIRGRGVSTSDSKSSNLAIGHIWNETPKGLLDPGGNTSSTGSSPSGGSSSGGGSSGGGGGGGGSPAPGG